MKTRLALRLEEDMEHISTSHPVFSEIKERYGLPSIQLRSNDFNSLVRIILEQQVSLDSGYAIFLRLSRQFGTILSIDQMVDTPIEAIRACGVTRQKAEYINGLANVLKHGSWTLSDLEQIDQASSYALLTSIRGIGAWTATIYMMSCLGARDLFPSGDIALIKEMEHYQLVRDKDQVIPYASNWSPYRTAAAHLLWHSYLTRQNRIITPA